MSGDFVEGRIEAYLGGRLVGWAWRPGRAEDAVQLEVIAGSRVVGVIDAKDFRADLAANDKRRGECAFDIQFDVGLFGASFPVVVDVRPVGSGVSLANGPMLIQSPAQNLDFRKGRSATGQSAAASQSADKPGAPTEPAAGALEDYLSSSADQAHLGSFMWEELLSPGSAQSSGNRIETLRLRLIAERRMFARSRTTPADRLLILPALAGSGSLASTVEAWTKQSWPAASCHFLGAAQPLIPCPAIATASQLRPDLLDTGWVLFARPGDALHPSLLNSLNRRGASADAVLWSLVAQGADAVNGTQVFRIPHYDPHTVRHNPSLDTCFAVRAALLQQAPDEVLNALFSGRVHPLLFWLTTAGNCRITARPDALTVRPRRAHEDVLDFLATEQGAFSEAFLQETAGPDFGFELHARPESDRFGFALSPRRRAKRASVIIPMAQADADAVAKSAFSVLRQRATLAPDFILVGDEDAEDAVARTAGIIARMGGLEVQHVLASAGAGFYEKLQLGAEAATSDVLVFCAGDTSVETESCLEEISAWALLPDVGAVGPRLRDPAHVRQEMYGYTPAQDGAQGLPLVADTEAFFSRTVRSCAGHSMLFCAIEARKFHAAGGLDPRQWPGSAAEIDFFLRLNRSGLSNLYLGHLLAHAGLCRHYECDESGFDNPQLALSYPEAAGEAKWRLGLETPQAGRSPASSPHHLYLPEDIEVIARAARAAMLQTSEIQAKRAAEMMALRKVSQSLQHAIARAELVGQGEEG